MNSSVIVRRSLVSLLAMTIISGCRDVTAPTPQFVTVLTLSPRTTIEGTSLTIRVVNNSPGPVVLARQCGLGLRVDVQQLVKGEWVFVGPAISCPNTLDPGPIELAPGAAIERQWVFSNVGRYRVGAYAAAKSSPNSPVFTYSVPFDIWLQD